VGQIDVANGARKSHPLALSQLLVGYHAVKAAMGVRAY
jgi:phosphoribulokinase